MEQPVSNTAERARVAAAMNALAHQRRVLIFEILRSAPNGLPYGGLLELTGLSLSTLNHHLRPMRAAGLVVTRRKGHEVIYRLAVEALTPHLASIQTGNRPIPAGSERKADPSDV